MATAAEKLPDLNSPSGIIGAAARRSQATNASIAAAPALPHSRAEAGLVDQLTRAFEAADVDGIVALLTDDAWLTMPPVPLEYQGRELCTRFFNLVFALGRRYRLVATRANGQPAFGIYVFDPHAPVLHANGLIVITLAGERISRIDRFDNSVLPRFGLPRSLPA